MSRRLKLRLDEEMSAALESVASAGGYSGGEELALHILRKELERLRTPEESGESAEEIRKKLQGLGYME
ncbi:hypothetical protein JW921_02055 [Candidatus Fermentibacterales bacterium]|nr:hypothetical protein [Candidatus Fermentibacterales bacterium]